MGRLVIGLDSSTQSLSALVIDCDLGTVIYEESLNFSESFPDYNCRDGFLPHEDPQVFHAPPLMWVEALDQLLQKLSEQIDMGSVLAIAGSGQQHGTVYLNHTFQKTISTLDKQLPIHPQIKHCFSRATAPIWMDASTSAECKALAEDLGGDQVLCNKTGSVAVERFSGPQIKKFAAQEAAAYAETEHIALVSSFMASLLCGRVLGVDYGDASGTNLLDLRSRDWYKPALESCGHQLEKKLGPPVDPRKSQGAVSSYLVDRYNFNPDCQVLPFSGDNPCSLLGLGLHSEGMTAISLGTSDTVFGNMRQIPETMSPWAHTFIAPTNDYMLLLCFKNGSLAREAVRKQAGYNWEAFSAAIESTEPANNGAFILPWFETEIVPKVLEPGVSYQGIEPDDYPRLCRAVVEAQMLSMRQHAAEAGLQPQNIRATGGASANKSILQIMADVFQCPVDVMDVQNSAALGAALRARQSLDQLSWEAACAGFTAVETGARVEPRAQYADSYAHLAEAYAECERTELQRRC